MCTLYYSEMKDEYEVLIYCCFHEIKKNRERKRKRKSRSIFILDEWVVHVK